VALASNNAVPVSTSRRLTATSVGSFSAISDFPLLLLKKNDHRRHALDGHKIKDEQSKKFPRFLTQLTEHQQSHSITHSATRVG
jgi:hypothetical protein